MENTAKLISALGNLIGAIAWPGVLVFLAMYFRKEIAQASAGLAQFMNRLRKMKIAGMEAELEALADRASDKGEITAEQTRAAAGLAIEAREGGREHILRELDKLCLQFDTVRLTMPSGRARTQEMTRIVVKMRALAKAVVDHIQTFKLAGSEGNRLAAIAIMQMVPSVADIQWLLQRFSSDPPFLFYQAALALTNVANNGSSEQEREAASKAANDALRVVRRFPGTPDPNTVVLLEKLASKTTG